VLQIATGWSTVCTLVTCHANDQNCYTDLLKTSLLPKYRQLHLGNDFVFLARQCSITLCKSHQFCVVWWSTVLQGTRSHCPDKVDDIQAVSTTVYPKLNSCWWTSIIFSRS